MKRDLRSIYLCFNESIRRCDGRRNRSFNNHVVRRIGLNSTTGRGNDAEELTVTANKISASKDSYPTRFTSLFSKIIAFPLQESRHICWLDTSNRTPRIQISSPTHCEIRSFDQPKHRVHLGEVDGRLYSIGVDPHSYPQSREFESEALLVVADPFCKLFELFDQECLRWRPLSAPPYVFGQYDRSYMYTTFHNYDTRFLSESKKILGWVRCKPRVFCFDTTNPENKWTQIDNHYLQKTIPFQFNPLFIHSHHPRIGYFYLIFTYKPCLEPLRVYPYFMSNTFDSFQPIYHPIHLPELCIRYIQSGYESGKGQTAYRFQFVHLGDQKVGLVIDTFGQGNGHVLLVTFEYDIIVTVDDLKPNIQLQTRLLGTRHFVYKSMDLARLDAAFLM